MMRMNWFEVPEAVAQRVSRGVAWRIRMPISIPDGRR